MRYIDGRPGYDSLTPEEAAEELKGLDAPEIEANNSFAATWRAFRPGWRLKALYGRVRRFIAYSLLQLLYGRADYCVDYTSRCPGCGYFDGEEAAGKDHYGYSCVPVDVGCWWPVVDWLRSRLAGARSRWRKYLARSS